MSIWTLAFWKSTAERTIATMATVLVALIGTDALPIPFIALDWKAILSIAVTSGLLTVLKSLAANASTGGNGPGFGAGEVLASKVVEKVDGGKVVAGEANEAVPTGQPIRDAGALSEPYRPQRAADDPEQH